MHWNSVESSNIHSMAHEANDLYVKFHSGKIYRYQGVPLATFNTLLEAESVGRTFNQEVKAHPKLFPYELIT